MRSPANAPRRFSRRRVSGLLAGLLALAVVLGAPVADRSAPVTPQLEEAADTRQFRAGNIISDQIFFDGRAMTAREVQAFLTARNPNCVSGPDGTPCLQSYRQDTVDKPAGTTCPGGYTGAPRESAARIIARVGAACGISQSALIVILQKEQGLVTASGSSLSARDYRNAMGYGCPDTAPCDPRFEGFFNQVYNAASRFNYYAQNPRQFGHRVGVTNEVRYHPSTTCGTGPVFIENQATAGLYNYTPYQPNAAALRAGKGTGDGCSAYGNRNFWIYFTDWFGSTQVQGAGEVTTRWATTGGATGPLGEAVQGVVCGLRGGGCFQDYQRGAIYWSPGTGARVVQSGHVRDKWAALDWERGQLGYPVADVATTPDGGWYGHFEHGSVYWSRSTGAHTVFGAIRDRWRDTGWERGPLGYPITDQRTTPDGRSQYLHFQRGSVYWSDATGARILSGQVYDAWAAAGWERGALGLPVSDAGTTPDGVGRFGHFENGSLYWTADTGAVRLLAPLRDRWAASGWERGPLGYPLTDQEPTAAGGGWARFQHGEVYWSATTGARLLEGPVLAGWRDRGGVSGPLGLPTSDSGTTPDGRGRYAHFQRGSLYTVGGAVRVLPPAVVDAWARTGWERGPLGYPVGDPVPAPDGRGTVTEFEGGAVHATATTGAYAVPDAFEAAWRAVGGPAGSFGYPVADAATTPDGAARYQHFEGGSLYRTPSGATVALDRVFVRAWAGQSWERGPLGYPRTGVLPTPDGRGRYAHFDRGSVYWTPTTGAQVLTGPVLEGWAARGWESGPLGYPTGHSRVTPDGVGRFGVFEGGSLYWTASTGGRAVSGAIRDAWAATGWERGWLRYPTSDVRTLPDRVGRFATFQGGSVYWSPSTGAHGVPPAVRAAWASAGWERGRLGYPTRGAYRVPGALRQDFQGGYVLVGDTTGRGTVHYR